jgi:TaqI-like C-terminal specificity domain/Eco57I restriction-modification methylase
MAQQSAREVLIPRYRELKAKYISTHYGSQKINLVAEIEKIKSNIAILTHGDNRSNTGFDWAVEFAEVMADGGFDIQLANPPYVRQEKITAYKPQLKKVFPEIYNGTSDLYCYFYARSLQLLKPGGMLAFISSNKWFRAGYGEKLRSHIADTCQVHSITDFGELPVFKSAATFPMIFLCQSNDSDNRESHIKFTQVKSLASPYPNVKEIIDRDGSILPSNAIDGSNWLLTDNFTANFVKQMESRGIPLIKFVDGQIYYGVKTNFDRAFVIDAETRAKLIAEDPASEDIIKPLVVGDDVRKWNIKNKDKWLIYSPWQLDINQYPAIKKHMMVWKEKLQSRPECKAGRYNWWCMARYGSEYAHTFNRSKIIYPEIAKESRFTLDENGKYPLKTVFSIPVGDLYLLGVLNSSFVWKYLKQSCSVLGDAEQGGRLTLQAIYLSKIPIPQASEIERKAISKLAQKCLDAKGVGCEKWEREIDVLVGRLYGFEQNHDLN